MQVNFVCPESLHFEELQEKLVALSGVAAVARLPSKDKSIAAFVQCSNEEGSQKAKEYLNSVGVKVDDDGEKPKKEDKKKTSSKKKPKNEAAKFFTGAAPQQQQQRQGRQQQSNQGRGGRGAQGRNRGGRGQGGGYRRAPYQWIQGFVAVLDNVPFNTTNQQLASIFNGCGQIYDINRFENMAMVYFEHQESVTNAISRLNGNKIQENVITVSNGGSVRVPVPV